VSTSEDEPTPAGQDPVRDTLGKIPPGARAVGMWCLWALVIGAVGYFVLNIVVLLASVFLTFMAGLLVTSLLRPVVTWLDRHRWNRLVASWVVVVGFVLLIGAVGWFLQMRVTGQLKSLGPTIAQGLNRLRTYLVETVGLSQQQVSAVVDSLIAQVSPGGTGGPGPAVEGAATGAMGGDAIVAGASAVVTVLAAALLALFTAFWLVYDGERVWQRSLRIVPHSRRSNVDDAGRAAWHALVGYLRGTTLVALLDALGVGLALVLIGVPLPFALALLTFVGGYIPIIGAFVAGLAAVVVAFAAGGLTDAALTLAAVVLVQQIEGNLLQPLIMRRTVQLHPLTIVYVLSIGGLLYGIAGAVVAVPVTAVIYAIGVAVAAQRGVQQERTDPPRRPRRGDSARVARPTRGAGPVPGAAPPPPGDAHAPHMDGAGPGETHPERPGRVSG
jgi:predicted PurR-regulated permease PerM